MIAVPLGPQQRFAVLGAPDYFEHFPKPRSLPIYPASLHPQPNAERRHLSRSACLFACWMNGQRLFWAWPRAVNGAN
jgi:hypothetical protein